MASDAGDLVAQAVARPHDPVRALACGVQPADDLAGSLGVAAAGVVRPDPAGADAAAPVVLAGVDAAGLPARRRRLLGGEAPRAKAAPGRRRSRVPDHSGLQPVRARHRFGVLLPDVLVRTCRPGARHRADLRQRSERHDRRSWRRCPTPVPCCSSSPSSSQRASRSISTGGPRSRPGTSSRSSDVPSRGEADISGLGARDSGLGRRGVVQRAAIAVVALMSVCVPAAAYAAQDAAIDQAAIAAGQAPEFDRAAIANALEAVRADPQLSAEKTIKTLRWRDATQAGSRGRGLDGSPGLPASLRGWGNRGGISCG